MLISETKLLSWNYVRYGSFWLKSIYLRLFLLFSPVVKASEFWKLSHLIPLSSSFCSVGWVVKWCPVSRITTPFARKRPFHWISIKIRLMRAAKETSKFQNWSLITNSRRRYIAELLPIWRKTLSNQSSRFCMWKSKYHSTFVTFWQQ